MAYTTIDKPDDYFNCRLYTGDPGNHSTVNTGFRPDFVWLKSRTQTYNHYVFDSSRPADGTSMPSGDVNMYAYLRTNTDIGSSNVEGDNNADGIVQTSTGFIVDQDSQALGEGGQSATSTVGENMVAWSWKANGGTRTTFTESGNDPGGGRQVDTTAGFGIYDYTGTGTGTGGNIAHGLGATPEVLWIKDRDQSEHFLVVTTVIDGTRDAMYLETGGAKFDLNTANEIVVDSTNIRLSNNWVDNNRDGDKYIMYAFAQKQGYSKFGTYVGNNNADGPFVYTGFKPAWVMVKATSGTENWGIFDNVRNKEPNNPRDIYLMPSVNNADSSESDSVDFLSNGFKWRVASGFRNGDGVTFFYMAFAESPFVTSNGVCSNAG